MSDAQYLINAVAIAEAACRYVEATAGLENTEEGRALLAAIGRG